MNIHSISLSLGRKIKERLGLFALLLFLQLLFIGSIGYVTAANLQHIVEGTQGVLGQLEQANFDPEKINEGTPFLNDIKPIYDSYQVMKKYAFRWLISLTIIAVTLYAALWVGSHALLSTSEEKLSGRKFLRRYGLMWVRFAALTIFFVLIIFILFSISIKTSLFNDPNQEQLYDRITLALGACFFIYYFFIAFAAQINAANSRTFVRQSYQNSLKRIFYSLPLAIVLLLSTWGAAILVKITLERTTSFPLLVSSTIIFAAVIITARLIWIKVQQTLSQKS